MRLEEGYAHKEAFLTLFVGYKDEIVGISEAMKDFDRKSYIGKLVDKVLEITSKDSDDVFGPIASNIKAENEEKQTSDNEKTASGEGQTDKDGENGQVSSDKK